MTQQPPADPAATPSMGGERGLEAACLRAMLGKMSDLAVVWGIDFKLIAFNPAFAAWARESCGREPMVGMAVGELGGVPEGKWINELAIGRVLRTNRTEAIRAEQVAQGRAREWEVELTPLASGTGVWGVLQVAKDVTTAPSDDRFQLATEAIEGLVWEIRPREGMSAWARPRGIFLGYRPEEIGPGEEWWQARVHPEDKEECYRRLREATARGDERLETRYRFKRGDGGGKDGYAFVVDRISIRYENGDVVRYVGCMSDRTERTLAELALERSEERYRALVETAVGSVWTADPQGNVLSASLEVNQPVPFPHRDPTGDRWLMLLHPEDRDRVWAEWRSSVETQRPYQAEYRILLNDGSVRWGRSRAVPVRGADGKVIEWVGTYSDIHDRKAAEEVIRESEYLFRSLAEAMPEALFIVSSEGVLEYLNPAFEQWAGYTLEEYHRRGEEAGTMGVGLRCVHPDDVAHVTEGLRRIMKTRRPETLEFRYRLETGEFRLVETRLTLISGGLADRSQERLAGLLIDLEERRRNEQRWKQQAEAARAEHLWLELVLDATPVPTMLVEQGSGKVLYVNAATRGFTQKMADSDDWDVYRAKVQKLVKEGVALSEEQFPSQRAARGEKIVSEELQVVMKDGRTVRTMVDAEPLPAAHGQRAVSVMCIRDVSRLKQVEEELRSALGAKDRFLAVLSHELRTPLTPVLTMAQLLEGEPSLSADVRDSISMIRRNVELETRLIDDLLDLTRLSRGKVKLETRPVELRALLRNVAEICDGDIQVKGIELRMDLPEGEVVVNGDAARLHQVFWNLLKNSIKFTPEGGRIEVLLQVGAEESAAGGFAAVRIRDTGIGIPAHLLPRVFDAFMQGDHDVRRYGGLGLGLAIARALVELHGGSLAAHSPGHNLGAEFQARLPMGTGTIGPATPTSPGPQPAARKLRILLVEDHVDTGRIMQRLLRKFGHQCTVTGSVAGAVAALKGQGGERYDLMISDIGLPDGNGCDVLKQMEGHTPPAPPSLALSGFGMDDDISRSRGAGFLEHLTKPVDATVLEGAIARAMGERVP